MYIHTFNYRRITIKCVKYILKIDIFDDFILLRIKLGSRFASSGVCQEYCDSSTRLASRFNCPAATVRVRPRQRLRSLPDAADNFHVNSKVNKNTDVSFNTLPKRTLCRPEDADEIICALAPPVVCPRSSHKDFNKLIYIPRRQPFCKLHSAHRGDRED